jgi:hypothetical protein
MIDTHTAVKAVAVAGAGRAGEREYLGGMTSTIAKGIGTD